MMMRMMDSTFSRTSEGGAAISMVVRMLRGMAASAWVVVGEQVFGLGRSSRRREVESMV